MTTTQTHVDLSEYTLLAAAPKAKIDRNKSERTITGICAVYGATGNSSAGPTRFSAGAIALPQDLSRVKLLLDHDATDPLGYMESAHVEGDNLIATFRVAEGERGDMALAQAKDKRRDALSVGCGINDWHKEGNTLVVTGATLSEVSLVSIPAFADARVLEVRSSRKDTIMDLETLEAAAAETTVPRSVEAAAATAAPEPVRAAPPVFTTAPRVDAKFGLTELVKHTASYLTANAATGLERYLTAALSDVTPVSIGAPDGPLNPAYVGELWTAAGVARPFLDAIGVGKLEALKMYGFKWNVRPLVAKYSGNKTEIPTNAPSRTRAEWTAQRFAGGWDIDRVFIDLPGGTDFIREVFVEATKDYQTKSEAYAVERLVAEGTVIPTESNVATTTLLTTIGKDVAGVKGSRIDVVQLGTARWDSLLGLTEAQIPWWVRSTGQVSLGDTAGTIGGIKFAVNTDLQANDAVVIDSRAVKAQEVDPPIKVQALDIAHGGVDLGVYGYIAVGVTDARLVRIYRDTTP